MPYLVKLLVAVIATGLMMTFVIGLSLSISSGFAGFWGGFPFMCIIAVVIALALYDFWEEAVRKD